MTNLRWTIRAIIVVCICASSFSQVIVYESSTQWSQAQYSTAREVGDEVVLAGAARTVTLIRFEYLGQLTPAWDKGAIVRLYDNSGPIWKGNTDYLQPAEPALWESEFISLEDGFHTVELQVPHIRVRGRLTWTVKFEGFSMTPGDSAGVLIYGDPWIGSSFNDLWERLDAGWTPVRVNRVPKSNIGLSVVAIAQAEKPSLSISKAGPRLTLRWGESFPQYVLQYQMPPSISWSDFPTPAVKNRDFFELVLLEEANVPMMLFRLKEIEAVEPRLEIAHSNNVAFIRWPASARNYVLQAKPITGDGDWTDLPTPGATKDTSFELSRKATTMGELYRLREGDIFPSLE